MGLNNIVAESDSLETIHSRCGVSRWWNNSSSIYADCVDLASSVGSVSFQHCPREANEVAHELARNSLINNLSCIWDDDPPSFILGKLVNDVTID